MRTVGIRRQQRQTAAQQLDGALKISAPCRMPAGGRDQLAAAQTQCPRARVRRSELLAKPHCLLVVVADDLLDLRKTFACACLEPDGVPLVQLCANTFGDERIRDVSDQDVVEAEPLCIERVDEAAAHQRLETAGDDLPRLLWEKLRDRAMGKLPADHRRGCDHVPIVGVESVEPCTEECRERRRDGDRRQLRGRHPAPIRLPEKTVVDQHSHQLLEEERIPP
jgi:hypothetical protein